MRRRLTAFGLSALLLALVLAVTACEGSEATPTSPARATATAPGGAATGDIRMPRGFRAVKYFSGLDHPTALAFAPDGKLYVTQQNGEVVTIADTNGDGVGDSKSVFASNLPLPLGLAFVGKDLYVSIRGHVVKLADLNGDGVSDGIEYILRDLPVGGRIHQNHQNNGITLGPDGYLYVAIGIDPSAPEAQVPLDPTRAAHIGLGLTPTPQAPQTPRTGAVDQRAGTVMRVRPDGSGASIYATGLRNPFSLAFDREGNLFGTDIGPNDPEGPDELNVIVAGKDYGFPRTPGALPGPGEVPAVALLEAAATSGMVLYNQTQFPELYRGNAFIAQWGQAAADVRNANRIVRVIIRKAAGGFQGVARSFAVGFEHPMSLALGADGSLYVADYGSLNPAEKNGVIYKISYVGG